MRECNFGRRASFMIMVVKRPHRLAEIAAFSAAMLTEPTMLPPGEKVRELLPGAAVPVHDRNLPFWPVVPTAQLLDAEVAATASRKPPGGPGLAQGWSGVGGPR